MWQKSSDADFDAFFTKFHDIVESVNKADVANTPSAAALDSLTILDWVRQTFPDRPALPQRVDMYVRALAGADPGQASMLYLAHYVACAGGIKSASGDEKDHAQYQRLVDGKREQILISVPCPPNWPRSRLTPR
jgi:monoamine oxidase